MPENLQHSLIIAYMLPAVGLMLFGLNLYVLTFLFLRRKKKNLAIFDEKADMKIALDSALVAIDDMRVERKSGKFWGTVKTAFYGSGWILFGLSATGII